MTLKREELLNSLADRCDAATGPDRDLDGEIAKAVGEDPETPFLYTASSDAADTLLDDEWEVGVLWSRDERAVTAVVGPNALAGFPLGRAEVRGLDRLDTTARALTAAALRALASRESDNG